jgi:hypothetical protein
VVLSVPISRRKQEAALSQQTAYLLL